jgi:hypothetical protein
VSAGDLCDLAGSLTPRSRRLEALVDHLNRSVSAADIKKAYDPVVRYYADSPQAFSIARSRSSAAAWLLERLR